MGSVNTKQVHSKSVYEIPHCFLLYVVFPTDDVLSLEAECSKLAGTLWCFKTENYTK